MQKIPFNKPYITGTEGDYLVEVLQSGRLSGNGSFTRKCQQWFTSRYGLSGSLLTSSGTDALEMCALLSGVGPGDEVIMPSFTFVSTANAFLLRGATIRFADTQASHPNLDPVATEALITSRTRAIVVVHYAGVACDMDAFLALAEKHNLILIEDAAHAIEASYKGRPLGSIGQLAAFSFHETKNITCGEGGLLAVNDPSLMARAEVLWEKGTNRAAFRRGEVQKYEWHDLGSSFLMSELQAAMLWAQIEVIDEIQRKRIEVWNTYLELLRPGADSGYFKLPYVPEFASLNGHLFYLECNNSEERNRLIVHLASHGIAAVFHYLPLHSSPYFSKHYNGPSFPNTDRFSSCILRLPLYADLSIEECGRIVKSVLDFYQ